MGMDGFFKGLTASALVISLFFLCVGFASVATGGLILPFVLAYIAYAISATCFAYEWIYKGFKVITEVDTRDEEIISVKQKQNDKIIGGWQQGWKDGIQGYNVWSEEKGDWVFVPEDQWKPPDLPEEGEEEKPITIENYPPFWWLNDLPDGDPPDGQSPSSCPSPGPVARGNSIL